MDDPYRYFRVESRELVDGLIAGVMGLERGAPAPEVVARMLRFAHTLKGAARVVRQPEIADHAHGVEDVLGPYRESAEPLPREGLDAILRLVDAIAGRVGALPAPEGGTTTTTAAREAVGPVRTIRADVVEMDALLDGISEAGASLGGVRKKIGHFERARDLVDLITEQLASRRTRSPTAVASERVLSLADELRRVVTDGGHSLDRCVDQLDRDLSQARNAAERLRLVSAAALFVPLERAARDVAHAQGKQVAFVARGGDVRLDAHIIATVQPALEQLVRNAVAHGIETDGERRAAGKPPEGQVTVEVARHGRVATFVCQDDGRGVDLAAVRVAARAKGLPFADTEEMGPDALLRGLLGGGITTSTTVTEVSGRGIGLDVARDAAERLGGRITAHTVPGRGTTIDIEVPLVLAALRALVVDAGGVTATIPLESVRTTMRVQAADLDSHGSGNGNGRVQSLVHEGTLIPFLPLATAISGFATPLPEAGAWSAVVVEADNGIAVLGVNRLLGTANVVIRPLPELAFASPIVSGATIDAQGNAQIVLDPAGLVDATRRATIDIEPRVAPEPILIVDDSLTTRMLEQSILESAGYEVDVAVSGEDALRQAAAKSFGLFLVDIEMPGMDGFTFIEHTSASPTLRHIPCIFVTSRASHEDQQRGLSLGARAYIAKQEFHQRDLLDRIREVMGG